MGWDQALEGWGIAQTVRVVLNAAEREGLAIVAERNRLRKHLERARIVLASDRRPAQGVAHSLGVCRPTVWRWQQRCAKVGIAGQLRDKTRKSGIAPLAAETTARVVALTCAEPPHQAIQWTGRATAQASAFRSIRCGPSCGRTNCSRTACAFNRSGDPSFATSSSTSSGSMSIRRLTRWCFRSMTRARSKLSATPNLGRRSSSAGSRS